MKIENVIYIYLAISLSLIAYNIVSAIAFRYTTKLNKEKKQRYKDIIKESTKLLSESKPMKEEHLDYLRKNLVKVSEMMAFDKALEEMEDKETPYLREMLSEVSSIISDLMPAYSRTRDGERMTFFLYELKRHHLLENSPSPEILDRIEIIARRDNLYMRENALQAIYSSGEAERVVRVLRYMDRDEIKHNGRLLADGLVSFSGDKDELIKEFFIYFERFSAPYKVIILNYIRYVSGDYGKEILKILRDEKQDSEVRYSAIRYFGDYYLEEAEPLLVELATENPNRRWEYRAIASKALVRYKSRAVMEVLKNNMSDPNWYVRYNSSESLAQQGYTYANMAEVFDSEDKYAIEMLQYRLDQRENREEERL